MSQKCNIAIIAGQLVVGGAERQLYLWLAHLDREKFQPVVLTLHPEHGDYWEKPIEALGIPLIRVPHHSIQFMRLLDITRILRPYEPQLIHGWHLFASPYAGATAKLLGVKSLGGHRDSFRKFRNDPIIAGLTLLLVDAIMFNSICAADQLRALFKFRKVTIHAVQNAIEDQTSDRQMLRKELSQRFGFSPNNLWIGSLGRLDPKKRFDLLFRVIALLQEDFKDFHFLLIGDGPERMHLEEMADTLGIAGRITFAGEVPGASAWLGALDIFCFTSLDEGIPNAVMEAAVAGVPIVTWGVPFIEEFLEDGKTARLVDPEDLPGFRDVLLELIPSPELRLMLGTNARDHVIKDFSLDRFIQQMTNLYDDLLGFSQAPDCVDA